MPDDFPKAPLIQPAQTPQLPTADLAQPQESTQEFMDANAWAPPLSPWPTLSQDALPGFIGDFVALATRSSEASTAAVLATALVRFGAELISPYIEVGDTVHKARLFAAVVGASS